MGWASLGWDFTLPDLMIVQNLGEILKKNHPYQKPSENADGFQSVYGTVIQVMGGGKVNPIGITFIALH